MSAEWITTDAAEKLHGIPAPVIIQAILNGVLKVRTVCGEALVNRAEVAALAYRMRFQCEVCGDD